MNVLRAPEHRAACYAGLQTCASVWTCPVCASKISERRRLDLAAAIAAWENRDGRVALVTYTVRHRLADDLAATLEGLLRARTAAKTGRAAAGISSRFGIAGTIRALEVTHGRNGWHPHLHELAFVRGDAELHALDSDLRDRWASVVRRVGLRDVNEHGVQVQQAALTVAEYVSKFGHARSWGPEHELAKQPVKQGRAGSRTPADLLADATFYADARAGDLWQHYARTFKGKRQLAWSRGLRDLLLPGTDEQTDEEVAADVTAYSVLLASLTRDQWRVILANDARAEVLQVAASGDAASLWAYLRALGC